MYIGFKAYPDWSGLKRTKLAVIVTPGPKSCFLPTTMSIYFVNLMMERVRCNLGGLVDIVAPKYSEKLGQQPLVLGGSG